MTMVAHVGPIFSCRVDGDMLYDDSGGQETKSSGLKSLFVSAMVPVHLRVTNKLISIHLDGHFDGFDGGPRPPPHFDGFDGGGKG